MEKLSHCFSIILSLLQQSVIFSFAYVLPFSSPYVENRKIMMHVPKVETFKNKKIKTNFFFLKVETMLL